MIKGLLGVVVAAVIFAAIAYGILQILGIIALIAAFFVVLGVLAFFLIFMLLFVFGFILFFAAIYYMIEKKPTVTPGEYTLNMEKGKNEK